MTDTLKSGTGGSIEALIVELQDFLREVAQDAGNRQWRKRVALELFDKVSDAAAWLTRRDAPPELGDELNLDDGLKQAQSSKPSTIPILPADAIRVWFRTSDKTLHIGPLTLMEDEAKRVVLDLLEFLPPIAGRDAEPWQPIETAPKRDYFGEEGISALVSDGEHVYLAERLCVFPDGSIGGSLPAHHGRLTDWGMKFWMRLPPPPTGAASPPPTPGADK